MSARKEWMLGIPGHNELVNIDQVLLLVRGGSLRPTDLVKKLGEPWRAADEVTELAPHFNSNPPPAPPKPQPQLSEAPAVKAAPEAQRGEPIRTTTDRVPRTTARIPDSSKSVPKIDGRAESTTARPSVKDEIPKPASAEATAGKAAEEKAPIRGNTGRVATVAAPPKAEVKSAPLPPREEKKEEKKTDSDKTDKISRRKPVVALPKPPPREEPRIEPMVPRYYSPVDMLRCASFAFEPKKLLYCAPVIALLMIWFVGMSKTGWGTTGGVFEGILFIVFMGILIFGMAFILTGLAFVSRRQLEGRDYYVGEVVHYTAKSAVTAVVYPLVALAPSLISLGILFLLGLARNRSAGMASTLRVGFILPMIFAFVTVLGALVYQIASMYVPAAGAIEGESLTGSIRHAWNYVRRQWGRVVLHWLIVTVAFGVISAVCMGLSTLAILLPDLVFGQPEGTVAESWKDFDVLMSVYHGLAYGLGMLLPMSLLSTLGTLSYLSLRTPAGAQLAPSPMDDTSGISIGSMRGTRHPGESTNPADTRPAPAENSAPLSDISDDSDEQPLVKD